MSENLCHDIYELISQFFEPAQLLSSSQSVIFFFENLLTRLHFFVCSKHSVIVLPFHKRRGSLFNVV